MCDWVLEMNIACELWIDNARMCYLYTSDLTLR